MRRKHIRILKHHRTADAYVDGRYLHINAKLSTRSKRHREIARELAQAILNEVGAIEGDLNVVKRADGHAGEAFGGVDPEGHNRTGAARWSAEQHALRESDKTPIPVGKISPSSDS